MKKINELWEMVLNGQAVAINSDGCSVCGKNAIGYSKFGDWRIVRLDTMTAHQVNNGFVIDD